MYHAGESEHEIARWSAMMVKRRSFNFLSLGLVAGVALGLPAAATAATNRDDFAAFRNLSQDRQHELVSGYVRENLRQLDGPMWGGRMAQQYLSVVPAALKLGATSFDDIAAAFSLEFMSKAKFDERLPPWLRRRLDAAIAVIPAYDATKGLQQNEVYTDQFNFYATGFMHMISKLKVGYSGASADMAEGAYDWNRV